MMSSNIVQTLAQPPAGRGAPQGKAAGDGFLAELAEGVGRLTGEKVSVEQLRAWLSGDAPDGFPTQALLEGLGQGGALPDPEALDPEALAGLLAEGEGLPEAAPAAGADGQGDVTGLLGLLALAREGGGRGGEGAAPFAGQLEGVLARLREGAGAQHVERASTDALDPEALAGLLAEGEGLPEAARAAEADGQGDAAGLLGLLALAREGGGRGGEGAAPFARQLEGVLARLRQGGGEEGLRRALAEAPGGLEAESAGDSRAFRQLVEAATAARDAQGTSSRAEMPTLQPVRTPVNQPGFSQAVGERVLWMARNEVQQARIQLNPPGLGPLEVSLQLGEERASVQFNAHHAATREALAADMPRLRTLLAEGGFENVDVNVSSQERGTDGRAGTDSDGSQAGGTSRGQTAEGEAGELAVQEIAGAATGRSLVDHYV